MKYIQILFVTFVMIASTISVTFAAMGDKDIGTDVHLSGARLALDDYYKAYGKYPDTPISGCLKDLEPQLKQFTNSVTYNYLFVTTQPNQQDVGNCTYGYGYKRLNSGVNDTFVVVAKVYEKVSANFEGSRWLSAPVDEFVALTYVQQMIRDTRVTPSQYSTISSDIMDSPYNWYYVYAGRNGLYNLVDPMYTKAITSSTTTTPISLASQSVTSTADTSITGNGYEKSLFSCLLTKVMLDYNGNMPLDLYNAYMSNMTTACDPEPTIDTIPSYMEESTVPYDIGYDMVDSVTSIVDDFVCGTDVVYDGFSYTTTVMPDGKCWTKQNMKHLSKVGKSWNLGDTIANLPTVTNELSLGRLYDWNAAMGTSDMSGGMTETTLGVCQSLGNGWKLPSDADWSGLKNSVGGSWSGNIIASSIIPLRNPALTNTYPLTDSFGAWWSSSINPINQQFTINNPLYFSIVCIYDEGMALNSAPSESITSSGASLDIGVIRGFDIILPESATVGESISIIVMAVDGGSNIVSNYTDKIFFQSTDTSATIPYATTGVQLTESDTGFLNLENSIIFTQTGLQTITVTDTNGNTGSASIMILP